MSPSKLSRALSTTVGVLLAVTLFGALACGGCVVLVWQSGVFQDQQLAEARRLAMPHLREQGIVALSDDAVFTDALGQIVLVARGKDHAGRLHDVAVSFKVAKIANTQQWQLTSIQIDGKLIYPPESTPSR